MIREGLLALADELEGMDCRTCPADGTKDCRDLPCEEAVARAAARRIREVVEHDACEDTTVSAYDLLSEEDRKALEWVRERGGLGAVEKRLMPEGMEWLLDVWPKWSNGEYCKFGDWWKAEKYGKLEPRQLSRLAFFTPEQLRELGQDEGENFGYEWDFMRPSDTTYRPDKVEPPAPKVLDADGVEIRVGDKPYRVDNSKQVEVRRVDPDYGEECVFVGVDVTALGYWLRPDQLTHERHVLDADWNRIEPAMDVWWICKGDELGIHAEKLHVESIGEDGFVECSPFNGGTLVELDSTELYVHKPVLDADGVPIKEGDTVYLLPGEWCDRFPCLWFYGGEELNVIDLNPKYGEIGSIKCCKVGKMTSLCYPQSSQLTHTKPEIDTWERINEDAGKDRCSYFGVKYQDCGRCTQLVTLCSINKSRDLVRRCRALAEKENRNE